MKELFSISCLAAVLLSSAVSATPIHVTLKATAVVAPGADGFFTLGEIASFTGGDAAMRTRFSGICVGRAPLSGENRLLTRGDIALKLRQAGCDPDKDAALEGATEAVVTVGDLTPALSFARRGSQSDAGAPALSFVRRGSREAAGEVPTPLPTIAAVAPLIHRGDAVTIIVQSDSVTITARGVARDNGGLGDTIRVHREGVMTDLTVTVLDSQTVRLEI